MFADGLIHAQDVPDENDNNFELYNQIRKLKTKQDNRFINWYYCTKCSKLLHVKSSSHYNELPRHVENDCVSPMNKSKYRKFI